MILNESASIFSLGYFLNKCAGQLSKLYLPEAILFKICLFVY